MTISTKYTGRPAPVASYDWLDIVSGEGYHRFYAGASKTGGSGAEVLLYYLTRQVIDGKPTSKTDTHNLAAADFLLGEWDFDIDVEVPMISGSGDALINFTHYVGSAGCTAYCTMTIYHVDGAAAETSIGTASSKEQGGATSYYRECVKIAMTSKKFGIGEKIRLNVKWYVDNDAAVVRTYQVFFDPASAESVVDTNGLTRGTDMVLDMPFKVIL